MSRLKLLGKNIRAYRELRGLTQSGLAGKVALSREYIADVERGHKHISLKKLFLVANTLEVHIRALFDFEYEVGVDG